MKGVKTKNVFNKELIDLLGDSIICSECFNIVYNPYTCFNCEINICKSCVDSVNTCKRCSSNQMKFFPDILRNFLKHLLIKCSNQACNEIKSYEEIEAHENICLSSIKSNEDSSFMKSFDKIDESRNIVDDYDDQKINEKILNFTNLDSSEIKSCSHNDMVSSKAFENINSCSHNEMVSSKVYENINSCCIMNDLEVCDDKCKEFEREKKISSRKSDLIEDLSKRVENLESICEFLLQNLNKLNENKTTSSNENFLNQNDRKFETENQIIKTNNKRTNINFEVCADCRKFSSAKYNCENCKKNICLKCSVKCSKCGKNSCFKCTSCEMCKITNECIECKLPCSQCIKNENAFCSNCISECNSCKKSFCKRCCGFQCKECEKICCITCSWNCKICLKTFCNNTSCDACGICGVKTCSKCLKECKVCNKVHCSNCLQKCAICFYSSCKRCSIKSNAFSNPCIICKSCVNIKN